MGNLCERTRELETILPDVHVYVLCTCFMIFKSSSWKNLGFPRSLRARIFQRKQKMQKIDSRSSMMKLFYQAGAQILLFIYRYLIDQKYSPSFHQDVNALKCKWKTFVPLLYIKRKPAFSLIVIEYCILSTLHDDSSSRFEICYEYLISPRIEEKEKKEKKKLLQKRST